MTRYAPVEILGKHHERATFDCGSEQQTAWLRKHALLAQQADTARVYVVRPHEEQRVAGYYALAAGSIEPDHGSARLAAGVGRHPIPVVILARLGVDLRDQRHGLGRELVRDALMQTAAVASRIGARALLIHAEFYGCGVLLPASGSRLRTIVGRPIAPPSPAQGSSGRRGTWWPEGCGSPQPRTAMTGRASDAKTAEGDAPA